MNYLEFTAGQLACQFIKEPDSLVEAFEQLFTALEWFKLGHERIEVGFEDDEDFWCHDCPQELLTDIEMAMQLARRHSDVVNRFCEDIDKGRGPSMKVGIRLISLVDRGKKPTKSMMAEWHNWDSELRDYVEFFKKSLVIDYLYSEEGYRDRGETKPVQQSGAARRIDLELSPTISTPLGTRGEHEEPTLREPTNFNAERWDKGQTVAVRAAEYLSAPHKAVEDIQDALARFDEVYDSDFVETSEGEFEWHFKKNNGIGDLTDIWVSERLKFVCRCVALASKRKPELFGILASELTDTRCVTKLDAFFRSALGKEKFSLNENEHPLNELEAKLQDFSEMLEFEMLTSGRYVNQSLTKPLESSANPQEDTVRRSLLTIDPTDRALDTSDLVIDGTPKHLPDGPDNEEKVFRWKGKTVEGFTPVGFELLDAVWSLLDNEKHRVRKADLVAVLPGRMITWKHDTALKSFSKFQNQIRKAFTAAEMPWPWEYDSRLEAYVKDAVYRE